MFPKENYIVLYFRMEDLGFKVYWITQVKFYKETILLKEFVFKFIFVNYNISSMVGE